MVQLFVPQTSGVMTFQLPDSIGMRTTGTLLRHVKYQGAPLVKGKHVTGFTNDEEEEMHLTHVVPFLVEDELMRLGATFEKLPTGSRFQSLMAVSLPDRIPRLRPSRLKTL